MSTYRIENKIKCLDYKGWKKFDDLDTEKLMLENPNISLSLILNKNKKVRTSHKIKIHKFIVLKFNIEDNVNHLYID